MTSCLSLCEILQQIDKSDSGAIVIDGFDEAQNGCIRFQNLKNTFIMYQENFFEKITNSIDKPLIAFYFINWNKNFYELFLSSVYCGYSFYIIDSRWPQEYCHSSIEEVKPEYIATDIQSEYFNRNFEKIKQNTEFEIFITKYHTKKPNDLAYVITTSGTTGKPKVVQVCNSSIIPNLYDIKNITNLDSNDFIYQASSLTFDPSIIEIFCTFASQCKLLILPQNFKNRPEILNYFLDKHKITLLQITPTLFNMIDSKIFEQDQFKSLILGGEKFPIDSKIRKLIEIKKNVFNIYGLTELSCWSSYHKVELSDLDNLDGVPIGKTLSETQFFVKKNNKLVELPGDNLAGEYEIIHSSKKRKCFIDGSHVDAIQSGDLVMIKNSQIYLKCRIDRLTLRSRWSDFIFSAFTIQENYLVLVVFCELEKNEKKLESNIRKFLTENLPFYYEPRKITIINKDNLPVTIHGKVDYGKIKNIVIEKLEKKNNLNVSENFNISNILRKLWTKILGLEPTNESNFIKAGGNSLKALIFTDEINDYIEQNSKFMNKNLLLDTILNNSFEQVLNLIKKSKSDEELEIIDSKNFKKIKFFRQDSIYFDNSRVTGCLSKNFSYLKIYFGPVPKKDSLFVKSLWKINTDKCVDATPLVVAYDFDKSLQVRVFIGSHSKKFICVDGRNGELKWSFLAGDRIESSACLDKSGNYVLFGSYDSHLYVIQIESGELFWKIETGDSIKSSPCIDFEKGYAYFGSYDKHLYCIDIEKKSIEWKKSLDKSSIFSGPICDSKQAVYVSTLAGNLFSLDKNCGKIIWAYQLDKATFTSPIIDEKNLVILLGTCGGTFFCIHQEGYLLWKFNCEKPIFTNACVADDLVIFGSYDSFLYCLNIKDGTLKWKCWCENEIYSSPFYDQSLQLIICINCDGLMFLFEKNGSILKKVAIFNQKNSCYSSPMVLNRNMYIGSRDDFLHCFNLQDYFS